LGIESALADVRNKPLFSVPLHLRNAPTKLMKEVGYSKGYKYPHEFDNHFIAEDYLPKELKKSQYYFPAEMGQEKNLLERLKILWKNWKKY
jgi:putative ATPase